MKKMIFTSLCMILGTGFVLAGNGKSPVKKVEKSKKQEPTCSVSCSTTVTNPQTGVSVTYTMTAGNFLTSCASAQQKCDTKMKATFGVAPSSYEL